MKSTAVLDCARPTMSDDFTHAERPEVTPGVPAEDTHAVFEQMPMEWQTAIFARFFDRMVRLARRRLAPQARQAVGSEAVAMSAFGDYLLKAEALALRGDGDLWIPLLKLTLKKCRKYNDLFKAKMRAGTEVSTIDLADDQPSPDEDAEWHELLNQIEAGLGERERRAFQLRLQGDTFEEIAAEIKRSVGMVHKIMTKVRAHVCKLVEAP